VPKEVAVMRMGSAGCLHDAAHEPFGAGSHVHRRGAQPELINADHLSRPEDSSLNQAVQSLAAEVGQRTLRCSGPRRSCTSMNGAVASSVVRSTEGLAAAESAVVLGCAGISMATNSAMAPTRGDVAGVGRLGVWLSSDGSTN